MKRKVFFIILVILTISIFLVINSGSSSKTIEEAIAGIDSKPINIIHEEKTDKGILIFYNHREADELSAAVVRKNTGGYKMLYSSTQWDIISISDKLGLSYQYLPGIEQTPLPIYYGVISNQDISQVKIIEKKRNITGHAKIIISEDKRIWLIYMSEFEVQNLKLSAFQKTKEY